MAATFVFLAAALPAAEPARAQQGAQPSTTGGTLPLFQTEETFEFTLAAPFRELRTTTRSREELDGMVRFDDGSGTTTELDVEVRVRGNSRLAQCDFPPLRLDFRRGQLDGTIFAGQNRLKLVTLCRTRDSYRDYLALEYDTYRLFSALTERSLRVRPVIVEYVTTDARREQSFTERAFLIESEEEAAARLGTTVIHREELTLDELDPEHSALLGVFQYVIGNTDWSAVRGPDEDICCHNGEVVGPLHGGAVVLPYDFDQAGLINTEYAAPNSQLRIRRVTQRLYRGFCAFSAETETAIAHVLAQRTALEAVLSESFASDGAKARALEFLRGSLAVLSDPAARREEIETSCRG